MKGLVVRLFGLHHERKIISAADFLCFILSAEVKTFKLLQHKEWGESLLPKVGAMAFSPDGDRAWPRRARCIYNGVKRPGAAPVNSAPEFNYCSPVPRIRTSKNAPDKI